MAAKKNSKTSTKEFNVFADVYAQCKTTIQADSFEEAGKIASGLKWSDFVEAKEELTEEHPVIVKWISTTD